MTARWPDADDLSNIQPEDRMFRSSSTGGSSVVHEPFMPSSHGADVELVRVIGVLEPGGAQLSALRLSRAQSVLGVRTKLLAGDATPGGLELARQHGMEVEAFRVHDHLEDAPRQWTPDPEFAPSPP